MTNSAIRSGLFFARRMRLYRSFPQLPVTLRRVRFRRKDAGNGIRALRRESLDRVRTRDEYGANGSGSRATSRRSGQFADLPDKKTYRVGRRMINLRRLGLAMALSVAGLAAVLPPFLACSVKALAPREIRSHAPRAFDRQLWNYQEGQRRGACPPDWRSGDSRWI
jgi:hypothetical protein